MKAVVLEHHEAGHFVACRGLELEARGRRKIDVLLAAAKQRRVCVVSDRLWLQVQAQVAWSLRQAPELLARRAQPVPVVLQHGRLELIASCLAGPTVRLEQRRALPQHHLTVAGRDDRPAFFPHHGSQKRLSPQVVHGRGVRIESRRDRPAGECNHPPVAGRSLHEVCVAGICDRVVLAQMPVRE